MTSDGPAWPISQLIAAGTPEWLAHILALTGILALIIAGFALIYCLWAGLRGYPRLKRAASAALRLDPAAREAFALRHYGASTNDLDVDRLEELYHLLAWESEARHNDSRLAKARAEIAAARRKATQDSPEDDEPEEPA